MPDLEITGLPVLQESSVAANDAAVVADLSASETKQLTVKALIAGGVAVIDDGDIPAVKVGTLTTNQVPSIAIQNLAVTNDKIETSSSATTGIDGGTKLRDGTVTVDKLDSSKFDRGLSVVSSKLGITNTVSGGAGTKNGITYSAEGLITSVGDLVASDLSQAGATTTALGAVSVPTAGALAVDSNSAISIADVSGLTPGTYFSVVVNAKGQVTGGSTSNSSTSIPTATTSVKGGVIVPSSSGLDVDASGNISIETQSGLTAGDYTKVTISTRGIITSAGSITGSDIPAHSAALLTTGTIPDNRIGNNAITTDRILNSAVNDDKISGVSGTKVATGSLLPAAINPSNLDRSINVSSGNLGINNAVTGGAGTKNGITYNSEGLITSVADLSSSDLANAKATTSALGVVQIGSGLSITTGGVLSVNASALLGANSVDTTNVVDGAITNSKVESSTSATTGLDGATKIRDGSIPAVKLAAANIDRSLNISGNNLGINNTVTPTTGAVKVNFNAQGLITGSASLSSSDLSTVIATSTAIGAVKVPSAGGLSVNGTGEISISATTTGASVSGFTFNNFGQITAATALSSSDLPLSTNSQVGGVQVLTGGGLSIDGSGNLSTATSGVTAGTYQSLTVNNKGVVTSGTSLTDAEIPVLPASKITTGTLDAARIAADSIDGSKLSDSSTAIIQSIAQSGFPTADFVGQLLFDPLTEEAWLNDGNAWNPITTLTKGALTRFGTYDPATSQVSFVTSAGSAAGLTVGQNLPTASDAVDGGYVVINNIGTPSGIAGITVELKPPDYLLGVTSSSTSSNWVRIELSDTVASQQASSISYTPFGQLSSTNVQAAINELETEKVAKSGSTISGELLIGSTGSLVFEGATADAFELTLAISDPQLSDKTLTLPDITGTLITDSDQNTVTSTMVDGSLVNANISASAGIQLAKLEPLASAKIIVGSSSGVATAVNVTGDISIDDAGLTAIGAGKIVDSMISGTASISGSKIVQGTTAVLGVLQLTDSFTSSSTTTAATPGAVKSAYDLADAALPKSGGILTNNLIIDNAKEIRFSEADTNGSNYLAFKAPDSVTADITWTLPDGDGSANQFLKTDGSGNLSWGTDSTTDSTKLPLVGGTLTGNLILDNAKEVRFSEADSNGSSYLALKAPDSLTGDVTWTLPSTDASVSGYVLASDGSGTLSWVNPGSNASPTFTGDATLTNDGALVGFSNLNATYTGNAKTLTVTVASKTAAHRYNGSGSSSGYLIGGKESPFLTLTPGRTYKFDQSDSSNSGHPLRFYLEADRTTGYTTNVTTSGTPGSSGAFTQIEITDSTPQILFYQCSAHSLMGNAVQTNSNVSAKLSTARTINGTSFDGSANITVTAAAGTLTGSTLASGITASSLTSLATLTSLNVSGDISASGTGAIKIPVGTDAQRPSTPQVGQFRWNSTSGSAEIYDGSAFAPVGGGAGATGGGNDETFIENSFQVTEDYTLSTGKNAVSVGVLQIAANKTVTIPSGRSWVVL